MEDKDESLITGDKLLSSSIIDEFKPSGKRRLQQMLTYSAIPEPPNEDTKMLKELDECKETFAENKHCYQQNWSLLHYFSFKGNTEFAKLLFQSGEITDVNARDINDYTPLHWASNIGHAEMIILLLDYGAGIEMRNRYDWTPLHLASFNGEVEAVRVLLQRGAMVNVQCKKGRTALSLAKLEAVRSLLKQHGASSSMCNIL